jgi:hypothetical protein
LDKRLNSFSTEDNGEDIACRREVHSPRPAGRRCRIRKTPMFSLVRS